MTALKKIVSLLIILVLFLNSQILFCKNTKGIIPKNFFNLEDKSSVELIGDTCLALLPISSFIINIYAEPDKTGLKQNLVSQITNLTLTTLLKLGFNELKLLNYDLGRRPDGTRYNVPSGHTSVVFTTSFHIQKRYGFKLALPFFILSIFTAYSRMYSNKHDLTAVVSGALLGMSSSYFFNTRHKQTNINLAYNNHLFKFTYQITI